MAIDFPNSPSLNETFTSGSTSWSWDGTKWNVVAATVAGPTGPTGPSGSFNVGDTAPASPTTGTTWYNSATGRTYVWYDSFWVEYGESTQLAVPGHTSSHTRGGSDIIDGDRLSVDYVPSGYSRYSSATFAGDSTDLTAHLSGIDRKLSAAEGFVASLYPSTNNTYTFGIASSRWSTMYSVNVDVSGSLIAGGTTNFSGSVSSNILPTTTATYNLGSATYRWANLYTSDLHLSNGVGDYTVIEGEENLYLVNNKSGKSFKFALIEVDPSEVPPKTENTNAS